MKNSTLKATLVSNFYNQVIKNQLFIASDICNGIVGFAHDPLNVVNAIDTSKFSVQCYLATGVKPTTAERYLREFRANDRILLSQ